MIVKNFALEISDALFPPLCLGCSCVLPDNPDAVFCFDCLGRLTFLTGSCCPVCGVIFPDSPAGEHLCGSCIEKRPWFTRARAAVVYEGAVLEAIHHFKYGHQVIAGSQLARFLADFDFAGVEREVFDVILPVPLHARRLRERGFNQSLILARALGEKFGIPVDFSLLKRRKFTLTQTGLDKGEREKNIKGAFEVVHRERLTGKKIILVDDVFTTGATVNECARTLRKAGTGDITVLTLARVL